jgi:hypothetical protein
MNLTQLSKWAVTKIESDWSGHSHVTWRYQGYYTQEDIFNAQL